MPTDTATDQTDPLTLEKLADEVRHLAGQVVLMHDTELVVLLGVGMDVADLYYIGAPLGRKRRNVWYSAVGACAGLKEYLPAETYERTERAFALNTKAPKGFQMLVDFDGGEPVAYDPSLHPEIRRQIQKQLYEDAVARVQRENANDII